MQKILFHIHLIFFIGIFPFIVERANASKILFEELAINSKNAFFKTVYLNPKRLYTQKTLPNTELKFKEEDFMKKLQIVDFGKKDYKFDPKSSMYYYDNSEEKEYDDIEKLEMKDFDNFVEFDVKKKSLNDK